VQAISRAQFKQVTKLTMRVFRQLWKNKANDHIRLIIHTYTTHAYIVMPTHSDQIVMISYMSSSDGRKFLFLLLLSSHSLLFFLALPLLQVLDELGFLFRRFLSRHSHVQLLSFGEFSDLVLDAFS